MEGYKRNILIAHSRGLEIEYGFVCAITNPSMCHWFNLPKDHEFDFTRFVYQIAIKEIR